MASGLKNKSLLDPLTAWELAALNILIALYPEDNLDVKASRANMLALIQALDRGDLDPALDDPKILALTESLLLAMLRGEKIQIADPTTFAARQEIFAAAQVVYNHAVARGFCNLHPDIRKAMRDR
jgi:hypothetical protein